MVYGEGSFNVAQWCGGEQQCPASCYTGNALDPNYQCPNTCTHCNDDAIIGHNGANVWVRTVPGSQRCGRTWSDANNKCGVECPHDTSEECPQGEDCFSNLQTPCPSGGGHRRRAQNFHLPTVDHCASHTLQNRLNRVNNACCADGCSSDGLPPTCTIQCAIEYAKFFSDCYTPLVESFGLDDSAQFRQFHTTCVHAFDTKSLLDTASTATSCQ